MKTKQDQNWSMDDELEIYLHFPFCKQKCYYCDFNSYSHLERLIPDYCRAIQKEIEHSPYQTRPVRSVYFGGGTPSYLPGERITEILGCLKKHFLILPHAELTIEVNPGTATPEKLMEWHDAGFNRLSLGLQAVQDRLLELIGRIHHWDDFLSCFQNARNVGFSNIGVDLIFGLPRQTLAEWQETLKSVVETGPEHISAYGLQLEPGTVLHSMVEDGRLTPPDEEETAAMMEWVMDYLPDRGYRQYEISNYALPGKESVHNMGYWQSREYLGFGAGAYSTVGHERWFNFKDPSLYIDRVRNDLSTVAERESLTPKIEAVEGLMLGLRTRAGIYLPEYATKHGMDLMQIARVEVANLRDEQLLGEKEGYLFLTDKGILVGNYVISRLLRAL